jgi:hypothetical protein
MQKFIEYVEEFVQLQAISRSKYFPLNSPCMFREEVPALQY